jgi:hypothetical protein
LPISGLADALCDGLLREPRIQKKLFPLPADGKARKRNVVSFVIFLPHIKSYIRRSQLKHSSKRRWLHLSVFHALHSKSRQKIGASFGVACDCFRSSIDGFKCDI